MRYITATFAPWDEGGNYKESTHRVQIPERTTKHYWDQVTIGGALWKWGMKRKIPLMPIRVISVG